MAQTSYSPESDQLTVDCIALSLEDKDESPPTTATFLCPSNLSGLLETATALSLGVASERRVCEECPVEVCEECCLGEEPQCCVR